MAEHSNVPFGVRDSDTVADDTVVGQTSDRSSSGTAGNHCESLQQQILVKQRNDIDKLTKAFESLQDAYIERMEKMETELKKNKGEIESLNKRLLEQDSVISKLQKQVESSKGDMVKMTDVVEKGIQKFNQDQMVCFHAKVSPSYQDIAPWVTIIFKSIETNVGNAYNSSNGEFSAPQGGLYVFYSNILSQVGKCIETVIQVNGVSKQCIYSGGTPSFQGPGGNMLVAHLKPGDKVRVVKHGPWGAKPFYIHHNWSSFSGFLLRSDS